MKPPNINEYGYIGDCHSSALISTQGSIDWCCMPRLDAASCFGRLLDWENGGYCQLIPKYPFTIERRYLEGTMILETQFSTSKAKARLIDFFPMRKGGSENPYQQIIRIVEGISGRMRFKLDIAPRFDYGAIKPWIRQYKSTSFIAMGGNNGLLLSGNMPMALANPHHLSSIFYLESSQRLYLSIIYHKPEELDFAEVEVPSTEELDWRLTQTQNWWNNWISQANLQFYLTGRVKQQVLAPQVLAPDVIAIKKATTELSLGDNPDIAADRTSLQTPRHIINPYSQQITRSALVLKTLSYSPTGAIIAAPTTSLPEREGGSRNWDYRYSWIRDSYFSVRALAALGLVKEADRFRQFIERSSYSSVDGLKPLYGVGGETRLQEYTIEELNGYHGAKPVRVGNAAVTQLTLDIYGALLDLAWHRHRFGASPDEDYWKFLVAIVNSVCELWHKPDCGFWEIRDNLRHFVHSKVMCWVALDRGIKLAENLVKDVPLEKWRQNRDQIRKVVETDGYDAKRGVFIQAFGFAQMDASLLLLPMVGFIDYKDERMLRTIAAIQEDLQENGLLRRYPAYSDGMQENEGVFLACSFWLVICLAQQSRLDSAHEIFQRCLATGNELGLFSEEYDTKNNRMLGNFPQGLTHLSLIAAALVLHEIEQLAAAGLAEV